MQGTAIQVLKKGPLEASRSSTSRVYCWTLLHHGAGRPGAPCNQDREAWHRRRHAGVRPFVDGESAYFMCFNRGKESIALDIKSPRDRELLERLLDRADVVVENFRPGVMDRLGYGAERLSKTHPHIVYASISGFGHTGHLVICPATTWLCKPWGGDELDGMAGWPALTCRDQLWRSRCRAFRHCRHLSALYKRVQNAQGTVSILACLTAKRR